MEFNYFSITSINKFIQDNNLAINKKLGQNFLINSGVIDTIIKNSNLTEKDIAFEIGCGLGSLTHKLIKSGATVIGFEIDKAYIKLLKTLFVDCKNFKLIEGDFLKEVEKIINDIDLKNFNKVIFFGNLPYYITTPILEKIFESKIYFDKLYFMMQKEVAQRILAKSGTKSYGALTIFCNYYADCNIIARLSPRSFYPAPKVDSVIMEFIRKEKKIEVFDEKLFFKVARSMFINRRKQIKNNLLNSPFLSTIEKNNISEALKNTNIMETIRGEELSIENIAKLSNELFKLIN